MLHLDLLVIQMVLVTLASLAAAESLGQHARTAFVDVIARRYEDQVDEDYDDAEYDPRPVCSVRNFSYRCSIISIFRAGGVEIERNRKKHHFCQL